MSHIHMTDNYAYQAINFWFNRCYNWWMENKYSPNVTYGSKGFFILKDGNSVTDQSGNNNDFTVGAGTLTKTVR